MAELFIFDSDILLPKRPADPGAPVEGEAWYNTVAHAYRFYNGTTTIDIGSGMTTEQLQDILGPFFADTADIDFTYDDAGNAETAIVKPRSITYAKLQAIATARILGRVTAGAGDAEELTAAQVKTLLAITSADISDFVAATRASITVADTATVDLTFAGGQISATVLDAPTLGGQTSAQIQTAIIAAITAGAPAALDTLNEIAAALGNDANAYNDLLAAIGLRTREFSVTVGDGAAVQIDVPHALGTYDLVWAAWDVAAPRAERHPGPEKPDVNTLRLTFNVAPANASVRVVVHAK